MNTQDIRKKEQEQVLAHAAERPSELFGLLDYIFDHANGDVDEAENQDSGRNKTLGSRYV